MISDGRVTSDADADPSSSPAGHITNGLGTVDKAQSSRMVSIAKIVCAN